MEHIPEHTRRHPEYEQLLERYSANPILMAKDWPYPVNTVFNPGAVRLQDTGEVLLLVRAEDRRGISHLCAARSSDGYTNWKIDQEPTVAPRREDSPTESWGVEDPRITWIPELEQYAVVSTAYSPGGPGVGLRTTRDFRQFELFGMVLPPDDKDAALFPCRFGGYWTMIHRPGSGPGQGHIWISRSPDLRHWGDHRLLIPAREGAWWDGHKVGLSTPPIETANGWLIFYHGVRMTTSGCVYRIGLALLDLDEPTRLIRRSDKWIFGPAEPYERVGDVRDVVFPCGSVLAEDGDTLIMYYGAADSCVCVATASVRTLLSWLEENHYEGTI